MQAHSIIDQSICRISPIMLEASDGAPLSATLFEPGRGAHGTVIVHGATATPAGYYRRFAEFLAGEGLRVLTYDYRGVGASRPPTLRGYRATLSDWAHQDATAAHRYVRERFGREPFAIVGHSFGGQLLGLVDDAREASGIVLVGAQLGYYGDWPLPSRLALGLVWYALVPAFTSTLGYLPGKLGIGEDLPAGVAEEWGRWCRHPDYLISEHPDAIGRFAAIFGPMLFYSFTDDELAPRAAVNHLLARLSGARVDHRRVHPSQHGGASIGHFGFFRPRFTSTLWRDAASFLKDALDGREPAGARGVGPLKLTAEDFTADLDYGRS